MNIIIGEAGQEKCNTYVDIFFFNGNGLKKYFIVFCLLTVRNDYH